MKWMVRRLQKKEIPGIIYNVLYIIYNARLSSSSNQIIPTDKVRTARQPTNHQLPTVIFRFIFTWSHGRASTWRDWKVFGYVWTRLGYDSLLTNQPSKSKDQPTCHNKNKKVRKT